MLVKVDDGFYLNTQHIIGVRILKNVLTGQFEVIVQHSPNSAQAVGEFKKTFSSQLEAEIYLNDLNQKVR